MNSRVFLGNLATDEYLDLFTRGLEFIEFGELAQRSTRVFIKPNLTYPNYKPGVMTSPDAVEAAILAIREYTSNLFIGDADSGGYNRFSMNEVYQETGIAKFSEKYGVEVVNLSHTQRKPINIKYLGKVFNLDLPVLLTDEIDLLVTMPVPKIHSNTGVSLAFKNQWGCIPEPTDRLRLHPYFKHIILEINNAVKTTVSMIDGKYGLNHNGPMQGIPVELNWILVANDIGASVRLACELMQIKLNEIDHLNYADKIGFIPEMLDIQVNQDFSPFLKEKFILRRKWTDIPGYLTFRSPFLAYIGYFSPLSEILHKILYIFREPLYDYDQHSRKG